MLSLFENDDNSPVQSDANIALSLMNMLNGNNQLVKAFRYGQERIESEPGQEITLHLLRCNTRNDVQYNLPSNGEIAAIVMGDCSKAEYNYDVLVHNRGFGLNHVSCLHPCYIALQYPLLFLYGEHGFHLGIRYARDNDNGQGRKYVTMLEYVRCHVHYKLNVPNP
jgi:hypothetical protein